MRKQRGFTLIEIAIVLVIIGLLLGGVLKGQELITAARVRNIASQLEGVKVAYLAFQDRYRAVPGDYALATTNIPPPVVNCPGAACSNGIINAGDETTAAWNQLSRAGFMTGTYDGSAAPPSVLNSPTNAFGGFLQLINDAVYDDAGVATTVLNIKTGGNIPSGVIAEIDRKIDDGAPLTGQFRSTGNVAGTVYDGVAKCTVAANDKWDAATDIRDCGGANLI